MRGRPARPVFMALACICITGCVHVGQQQQQPWRLFTLSPLSEPEAEQAAATSSPGPARLAIGVGPVHLPGYLDQDQMVTRITQHRITLSGNDRWAEPLEDNMAHAVAQNLSMLLQADGITVHTWPGQQRPTYQVEIDVLTFETDTAGTAHLAARWFLHEVTSRQTIAEREIRLTASGAGISTEQSVASLSKALGEFSVGIANAVRELSTPTVGNQPLERETGRHQPRGISSRPGPVTLEQLPLIASRIRIGAHGDR